MVLPLSGRFGYSGLNWLLPRFRLGGQNSVKNVKNESSPDFGTLSGSYAYTCQMSYYETEY